MENLGYNTRGPLIEKLKSLLNEIQSNYEAFLDAQTLFEQGRLNEREFFMKMGEFVKIFASLVFLSTKVILELDKSIPKERLESEGTKPMPSKIVTTVIEEYKCKYCGARIPQTAKFCTKCGKKQ